MRNECVFAAVLGLSLSLACCTLAVTGQTATQIAIDGDPSDWSSYDVLLSDPQGDHHGGGFDIASVQAFTNDRFLYLLIETYGSRHDYVQVDLEFETGGRRFIVSFNPEEGEGACIGEVTTGEFISLGPASGSRSAAGRAVEFKMPLSALGGEADLVLIDIRPMAGECCEPPSWYPVDRIEPVTIPWIDEVEPAESVSISGCVVQASSGDPIGHATVELVDATRSLRGEDGWYWPLISSTRTNAEGAYAFGSIPTTDYWILAYADGYAREVYDQEVSIHEAPVVPYVGLPICGVDFALNEGGTIVGRVTEADGVTPVPNIMVQVAMAKYAWLENRWYTAVSGRDGTYRVENLPLGEYMVGVREPGFATEYYDDVHYLEWFAAVAVTPPGETRGVDMPLDLEGRISGWVVDDRTGEPISGAILHSLPQGPGTAATWGMIALSAADGSFSMGMLPPAQILLSVRAEGYGDEIYDHQPGWSHADLIRVTSGGHVEDVTVRMRQGGLLAGHLYDAETGEPLHGFLVSIHLPDDDMSAAMPVDATAPDGSFSIRLPSGTYIVWAQSVPGYVQEYYRNSYDYEGATPLRVAAGGEVTGVDLFLQQAGVISGVIYESDGSTPIPDAQVFAFPVGSGIGGGAISEADGSFRIEGLPSGSYRVQVKVPGSDLLFYFPGVLIESAAWTVWVHAPAETDGIDIVVP
jgi:hypothetical protein